MLSEETIQETVSSFFISVFAFREKITRTITVQLQKAYAQGYQDGRTQGIKEAQETASLEKDYNRPVPKGLWDAPSKDAHDPPFSTFKEISEGPAE